MSNNKLSTYSLVASSDDTTPNFVQPSPQPDIISTSSLQPYSFNPGQTQTRPNTPASTNLLYGHTVFRNTAPLMADDPFISTQAQARTNTPAPWWGLGSNISYDGSSTPALSHELNAGTADHTARFAVYERESPTGTINSGPNRGGQLAEKGPWGIGQLEGTTMYLAREQARLREENFRCGALIETLRQQISQVDNRAMRVSQLALRCQDILNELRPKISSLGELNSRVTALEVRVALMDRDLLGACGEGLDDKDARSV